MTRDFTDSEIDRHDTLVDEGWKLVEGQLLIHGNPPVGKPGFLVRRRLQKAIGCFEEALEINPEGWQSMWALGRSTSGSSTPNSPTSVVRPRRRQ